MVDTHEVQRTMGQDGNGARSNTKRLSPTCNRYASHEPGSPAHYQGLCQVAKGILVIKLHRCGKVQVATFGKQT